MRSRAAITSADVAGPADSPCHVHGYVQVSLLASVASRAAQPFQADSLPVPESGGDPDTICAQVWPEPSYGSHRAEPVPPGLEAQAGQVLRASRAVE